MAFAKPAGGAYPLVGAGGRHPNVGDDDVGVFGVDHSEQPVEVATGTHEVEVVLELEQAAHSLTHDDVVLGQHEPNRHIVRLQIDSDAGKGATRTIAVRVARPSSR